MAETYHYPPELLQLLVDTIPLLCRSKNDVVIFFRGAGTPAADLAPIVTALKVDPSSVNKYHIARTVIEALNARGDSTLAPRREIIKRVVEFEDFSTCWPNDQLKARGLVAQISKVVNVKDSFTRMKQERDTEKAEVTSRAQVERAKAAQHKKTIGDIRDRLYALFPMGDTPQIRGKALEAVLNDLFRAYGVLVREDFKRRDPDTTTVLEQIDGVIELNGIIHLVEMKWLREPVGIGDFSPHLSRLFLRSNANGIFISASDYTEPVIKTCTEALSQKTVFLCTLKEIVMLIQREGDLLNFLQRKSQSAIVDKRPYLEIIQ